MSLLVDPPPFFAWSTDNYGAAPSTSIGTNVTANASANTMGTYTALFATAAVPNAVHRLDVIVHNSAAGAGNSQTGLVDIGIDPAGGTNPANVTTLIPYVLMYGQNGLDRATAELSFPIYIPAGASIWAKTQHAVGSTTAKVAMRLWGVPSGPIWSGSFSETIGAVTASSKGTNVACTNNTAWNTTIGTSAGNWHSLGTTTKRLRHVSLMVNNSATTVSNQSVYFGLGYGDGSNVVEICSRLYIYQDTGERTYSHSVPNHMFCDIPAGSTIYVRGHAAGDISGEAPNAMVVGIG